MTFQSASRSGSLDGTQVNTLVPTPSDNTRHIVSGFVVQNPDTAAAEVIITYYDDDGSGQILLDVTLAVGDQLVWGRDDPPIVLNTETNYLTIELAGAITTNNVTYQVSYGIES